MESVHIAPESLIPVHGVKDAAKLAALVASLENDGWSGRPLLACTMQDGSLQLLTGSHRIAAAVEAAVEVPVVILGEDVTDILRSSPGWDAMYDRPCDPESLIPDLRDVDVYAADLLSLDY